MIAAVVKIGKQDISRGSGGGSGSATYSWVDPELGVDIFDYENVLTLDGRAFESWSLDGGEYTSATITYKDGVLTVVDPGSNCAVSLGDLTVSADYTYYFFGSVNGSDFERLDFNQSALTLPSGGFEGSVGFGSVSPYYDQQLSLMLNAPAGEYIFRVIAIPD